MEGAADRNPACCRRASSVAVGAEADATSCFDPSGSIHATVPPIAAATTIAETVKQADRSRDRVGWERLGGIDPYANWLPGTDPDEISKDRADGWDWQTLDSTPGRLPSRDRI
jgi:hypothetical protein